MVAVCDFGTPERSSCARSEYGDSRPLRIATVCGLISFCISWSSVFIELVDPYAGFRRALYGLCTCVSPPTAPGSNVGATCSSIVAPFGLLLLPSTGPLPSFLRTIVIVRLQLARGHMIRVELLLQINKQSHGQRTYCFPGGAGRMAVASLQCEHRTTA